MASHVTWVLLRTGVIAILCLSIGSGSLQAVTVIDTFDTGYSSVLWSRDSGLNGYDPWTVAPDGAGRLEVSKPADPGGLNKSLHGGLTSSFQLLGDFAISVDFQLLDYPHPGNGYNEVLLLVAPASGPGNFGVIKFSTNAGGSSYTEAFEGWSNPPATPLVQANSTSRSGTFEIRRVGNEMSAYIDYGNGLQYFGSVTNPAFSGPMIVHLYGEQVVRGATGERSFSTLDVRFDNFQATDETVVPEPVTLLGLFLGLGGIAGYVKRLNR